MRRVKYFAVLATIVAGLLSLTGCDDEQRISYGRLPSAARVFIETYFPTESCVYAERDRDDGRKEYEVKLANGVEIDFHGSGDWKKVDCKYSFLPAGIVPEAIVTDLATHYPGAGISKAERALGGYEITVGDGLELIYSSDGRFVRTDMD